MIVHLVDGTYELFRYFFAVPSHLTDNNREVGGTRGVVGSMLSILEGGATHVGIATDHVIESFRNDLLDSYKTGAGIDPALRQQFTLLEDTLTAVGFCVWPMVEFEADDAMGAAAKIAATDARVERVMLCTPDKDLGQCVTEDGRVVQFDRRRETLIDYAGVIAKFGVPPASIPDYLALVGDAADGIPGVQGWGSKTAGAVLARYGHIEHIPLEAGKWDVSVRGAAKLVYTLANNYENAMLYRRLATIETDAPTITTVDELEWKGPRDDCEAALRAIDADAYLARIDRILRRKR
ncbi:MAG: 5'-3' exonuclease H3TH domain-containing protein [Acidimicrobiales bacterium]